MKITIGSDHRGYDLKEKIKKQFADIDWVDVGSFSTERQDYPIFAKKVCENILQKKAEEGILICGSGIGMSIAANRFRGIYAALSWDTAVASIAKEHDRANVLVLASDFITEPKAFDIVQSWILAKFKEGRYLERLKSIDGI